MCSIYLHAHVPRSQCHITYVTAKYHHNQDKSLFADTLKAEKWFGALQQGGGLAEKINNVGYSTAS